MRGIMLTLCFLVIESSVAVAASAGLTFVHSRNNNWDNADNWINGHEGGWNGLVDLSVSCINDFNAEREEGMAIGLNMDVTAGKIKFPEHGRIVFGKGPDGSSAKLVLTGQSSHTKQWKCQSIDSYSSACPDSYQIYNSTTGEPVVLESPRGPCHEDIIVINMQSTFSIKWYPHQYIAGLVIANGYVDPNTTGAVIASWPADLLGDTNEDYPDYEQIVSNASMWSRFSGHAPTIAGCQGFEYDCDSFCINGCPAGDINDPNIADLFGLVISQEDMNGILDSAIRERVAMANQRNVLNEGLVLPRAYFDDDSSFVSELLSTNSINLSEDDMISRLVPSIWIEGILMGWRIDLEDEAQGLVATLTRPSRPATVLDHNLASLQLEYALHVLADVDGPRDTLEVMQTMLSEEVIQVGSEAAHKALFPDVTDGLTAAIAGPNSRIMLEYMKTFLTNSRAQTTARWFSNTDDTGDVTAKDWEAVDFYSRFLSNGNEFASYEERRNRRALISNDGVPGEAMTARLIAGTNALLASTSATTQWQVGVESVESIKCGSLRFADRNDPYAPGGCNLTAVTMSNSNVYHVINNTQQPESLISPAVVEGAAGVVLLQMSAHAVSMQLSDSINNVNGQWAAFTATPEEEGLPMLYITIGAAAGALCITLIVVLVVVRMSMSNGTQDNGGYLPSAGAQATRSSFVFDNKMYADFRDVPTNQADDEFYDEPVYIPEENTYDGSNYMQSSDAGDFGYLDVDDDDDGDEDC